MKTDKWTAFATISFMAVLLISPALFLLAIVKGHFWTAILLGFVIGVEIQLAIVFYRVIESTLLDIARWLAEQMPPPKRQRSESQQTHQPEANQPETNHEPPWERIPDHLWDREAVRLWWEGLTAAEIGKYVHATSQRVTNRLSELRKQYGTEIVPYDKERHTL